MNRLLELFKVKLKYIWQSEMDKKKLGTAYVCCQIFSYNGKYIGINFAYKICST